MMLKTQITALARQSRPSQFVSGLWVARNSQAGFWSHEEPVDGRLCVLICSDFQRPQLAVARLSSQA